MAVVCEENAGTATLQRDRIDRHARMASRRLWHVTAFHVLAADKALSCSALSVPAPLRMCIRSPRSLSRRLSCDGVLLEKTP